MPARGRPIAQVPFVNGVVRAAYEESDGRQAGEGKGRRERAFVVGR
jgi:hypothetical protein